MTSCVAINCSNRSEKGFRLFPIPTNVARRKKVENINLCMNSGYQVHFEDSLFESRRVDGWRKLKPNAVPTLFHVPNPPPRIDSPPRKSL
ncbi:peroxynitrite isomerase THAP4-like [Temnothorax nylanderi]|uniref:peroxynitrite isomerase THAP4-like n=1 Tax=Temnothorax nylanderi TaxID=102681 RepID=UPI003A87BE3C